MGGRGTEVQGQAVGKQRNGLALKTSAYLHPTEKMSGLICIQGHPAFR